MNYLNFLDKFNFNGSDSFKDFFDGVTKISQIKESDNKVIFNVSGYEQNEVKASYDPQNNSVVIACVGDSPIWGESLKYETELPPIFSKCKEIKMSYKAGVITLEPSEAHNSKTIDLSFNDTLHD